MQLQAPHFCAGSLPSSNTVTVCCPKPEALLVSFPSGENKIHQLGALCQEATFGRAGQDVLEPSYRKALALGNGKFFTNFDLGAQDILNTIKAVMMPDAASIRAELYKLNVYRPGDFFKAHVDTPRGQGMFGSLVVCLPQQHTGGELLVRHKGEEQRFDFAAASSDTVQWAAFYSDCEHEILPVQSGHRITLTYNLYATASAKLSGPHLPDLDSSTVQLYSVLARSLATPDFLAEGGDLAVPCEHVYPHTHQKLLEDVPALLKGQDALYYKVFQQLGLETQLQAVHDFRDDYDYRDEEEEYEEEEQVEEEGEGEEEEKKGKEEGEVKVKSKSLARKKKVDKTMRAGNLMAFKVSVYARYDWDDWSVERLVESSYNNPRPFCNIIWLKDMEALKYQVQTLVATYGNHASSWEWYSAAAVFAAVPAWGTEEREQLVKQLPKA